MATASRGSVRGIFRVYSSLSAETIPLSPAVRFIVDTNHLDVLQIKGTGPKGRILKGDVLAVVQQPGIKQQQQQQQQSGGGPLKGFGRVPDASVQSPVPPTTPPSSSSSSSSFAGSTSSSGSVDEPLSSMRRTIAKRLTHAKNSIPHAYASIQCRAEEMVALRKRFKGWSEGVPQRYHHQGGGTHAEGVPCPVSVTSTAHNDTAAVTVTWSLSPTSAPVTSTTVTYCPTSSPNCADSQVCTSPCIIRGLTPNTDYQFTITTTDNCGSRSCTGSMTTAKTACVFSIVPPSTTPIILAGVTPSVVLILINVASVVVVFLVTRHFYKKSVKEVPSLRQEQLYAHVEERMTYEDITMTDSPAYGPIK